MTLAVFVATGNNLCANEILPRVYPQFVAFLYYRWEVIIRETDIPSIHTLGICVEPTFAIIRFDRAFVLILMTALVNFGIDAQSRTIRSRLQMQTTPNFT